MRMSKARVLVALIFITFLHLLASAHPQRKHANAPTKPNRPRPPPRLPTQDRGRGRGRGEGEGQGQGRGRGRSQYNGQRKPPMPSLSTEEQGYLNAHNTYRQKMHLQPFQWDRSLAKYAHDWALKRIDDCHHRHHSKGPYGENIFWQQYDESTPANVVKGWTDERNNYDHQKLVCKCPPENSDCMCGHYTQVVWSTSKRVGCGSVTCNNEKGIFIVCEYNPPGNVPGVNPLHAAKV